MEDVSMLALAWLLACVGCVASGLLTWALLEGAARVWPGLRTRRAVWLAAQCVAATTAILPFLPQGAQIGVAPRITLPAPAAMQPATRATTPAAGQIAAGPDVGAAIAANSGALIATDTGAAVSAFAPPVNAASRIVPLLAALWLLVYAAGLAWTVARQLHARRLWRVLLASAQHLSSQDLLAHGAFSSPQLREIARRKLAVLRTDAAISPMLIGVAHPRLLLPADLDALTREQQHMIIAHELHHLRVRDPLCLAIASILQTVFWFNPALRWMAKQMEWALELSCDQHVLAGRPQQQRKQYAAALLRQWTSITPAGAAAFGGATIASRIRSMQQDGLPALSAAATWLIAAALAAILTLAMLLQPALAYSQPAAAEAPGRVMPEVATGDAPANETWRAPVDKVRVTSFFGVMRSVLPTPHKGIDFAAAKGTPVRATASGTVIAAGPLPENEGRYGNAVIIDHGAQQTLYAHLDRVNVKPGQHVTAGELIGASGQSGFTTGPHLHLELRENGRIIDPASRLDNLDAYATARALKVRRQQKG
ncbi:M23/M56 family metallopeptidase [Duganella radicis]|uniref:Peptidoglycan DD-metalloendopeptidase family protein n=1 Tax=Duganella radicis TaxID=551988 RepID=A0A6L6PDC5_9BURK|nr:M23/M56 family metallopeptidase [Duganella radicis]MTV36913.1 peptidoglycan DD-metalloendopeptidase family protein [Duganella radicis]